MFKVDLLDFESEFAIHRLELMAKDLRTQPAPQNFIPTVISEHLFSVCLGFARVLERRTVFLQFHLNDAEQE